MPHEASWRSFFGEGEDEDAPHARSLASALPWREMFSVYVHAPPRFKLPSTSFFASAQLPAHVHARWGEHTMISAERHLFAAALSDPTNMRFVTISDSCIPVFPRTTFYLQALAENKSRVMGCRDFGPNDNHQHMPYRRDEAMEEAGITWGAWRKSSQWIMLNRRHAEVVVRDQKIDESFQRYCSKKREPICISDEHYIPTLLAVRELSNETSCEFGITYTAWESNAAHPVMYVAKDARQGTVAAMRGGIERCSLSGTSATADATRVRAFAMSWSWDWSGKSADVSDSDDAAHEDELIRLVEERVAGALKGVDYHAMPTSCTLLARKVHPDAAIAWRDALVASWDYEPPAELAEDTKER